MSDVSIGRIPAPPKKNPFYEPGRTKNDDFLVHYSSIDMQAIHLALVHKTTFGGSARKSKRSGTITVPYKDLTNRQLNEIKKILRACAGYYSKDANTNIATITFKSFLKLCNFLEVSPLQLICVPRVKVIDPLNSKTIFLSILDSRKRWAE